MSFGNEIRLRRIEMGLTQAQLGKLVGVGQPIIYAYEKGKAEPSLTRLLQIAKALEVSSLDDFFRGEKVVLHGNDGEIYETF